MLKEMRFKTHNLRKTTHPHIPYPLLKRFYLGSINVVFPVAKCFEYECIAVERTPALYPEVGTASLERSGAPTPSPAPKMSGTPAPIFKNEQRSRSSQKGALLFLPLLYCFGRLQKMQMLFFCFRRSKLKVKKK